MTRFKTVKINQRIITYFVALFVCGGILLSISCADKDKSEAANNPKGYDLAKPVKYNMPDNLSEISGIAFYKGNNGMLYAEQDEDGYLYSLKLGDKQANLSKFGKKGDYEDIAICHDQVVMLRSDGVLFTFPFNQIKNKEIQGVQKLEGVLPQGEFEGMFADEKSGKIYILCKHCADDKTTKSSSGYIFDLQTNGTVKSSGTFSINVKSIGQLSDKKKVSFHPSALTQNPVTKEWFILSSVNKMLVVAGADWNIKAVYPLDGLKFNQPEGITFDSQQNLYISNEGDQVSAGNVLKFIYKKQ